MLLSHVAFFATDDLLRLCPDAVPVRHASATCARHAALTALRCLVCYLHRYVLAATQTNNMLVLLLSACDETVLLLGLVRMFLLGDAAHYTCLDFCTVKAMMYYLLMHSNATFF